MLFSKNPLNKITLLISMTRAKAEMMMNYDNFNKIHLAGL